VRGKEWAENLEQADHSTGLRYSTIHNAKGGEYCGVCVVIPPDDARKVTTELIEMWERGRDHEAKRVIYVGVTRAQHLAALAIPVALRDRCTSILDAACVPYRVHE
jgi:hypothetical protein